MESLVFLLFLSIIGLSTWITYEFGLNPDYYHCSSNNKQPYCNKYQSVGIGQIVSNDYKSDPVASYNYYTKIYHCNLHHVKYNDYPVGKVFNIYTTSIGSNVCVTEKYNNYYINTSTQNHVDSIPGIFVLIVIGYIVVLCIVMGIVIGPWIEKRERDRREREWFREREREQNQIDIEANIQPQKPQTNNKNQDKQNIYKIPNEKTQPLSNAVFSVDNKDECYKCLQPLTNGQPLENPPCRHLIHTKCYKELVSDGYVKCSICEQNFV